MADQALQLRLYKPTSQERLRQAREALPPAEIVRERVAWLKEQLGVVRLGELAWEGRQRVETLLRRPSSVNEGARLLDHLITASCNVPDRAWESAMDYLRERDVAEEFYASLLKEMRTQSGHWLERCFTRSTSRGRGA